MSTKATSRIWDRFVAVKVLHPHLSEEADFITRFQREAKSVAGLHHPHIVQVFDFGSSICAVRSINRSIGLAAAIHLER